jgi:hypothetical protein
MLLAPLHRRFLLALLGGVLTTFVGSTRRQAAAAPDALAARLAAQFQRSRASIRVLGAACRTSGTGCATRGALLVQLCPDPAERTRLASATRRTLQAWIDTRIEADFIAGRIVRVDGWVLSRTEALLYALIATS